MDTAATPETGAVGAPASMDSVLAEFETGTSPPEDVAAEVVRELDAEAEEGQAAEAADDGEATDASEDGEDDQPNPDEPTEDTGTDLDMDRVVTVKIDGEDVQVPLSEALKGYSREADYTKKTQALAEERKSLETTLTAKYADNLKQATDLFMQTDPILAEASQIDWNALAQADPSTYTQLRAAVDQRLGVIGQAQAELQRVTQETARAEQERNAEQSRAEADALIKALPDLADASKMTEFAKSTVDYLRGSGFQDAEIADLIDHKALLIVDKAAKWDAQQKAKAQLPARKVVPVSQVKSLRTDGSSGSQPPRKRLSPNASREQRVEHVVNEFFKD
ncbi:MAG TPA: hypothetical protein VF638_01030 [Sphingomonas sp.]|jgi:hypothetical protein